MATVPVVTGSTPQPTTSKSPPKPKIKAPKKPAKKPAKPKAPAQPALTPAEQAYVNAAAKLQYGGQQAQLGQVAANIPNYYDAYRIAMTRQQQMLSDPNGPYQQAIAGAQARAAAQQAAAAGAVQQSQQAAQADAASRGATAGNQVNVDALNAAAVRQQQGNALADVMSANAANQGAYITNRGLSSQGEQLLAQTNVGKQQATLKGQVGAFKVKTLGDYRAQQAALANQQAQNQIAAEGLGLKAATITQTAADKAAQRKQTQKQASQVPNKWGYLPGEWRKLTPAQRQQIIKQQAGYGKTPKAPAKPGVNARDKYGNTPADITKANRQWNQTLQFLRDNGKDLAKGTDAQVAGFVQKKLGVPYDLVSPAIYWWRNKAHLTPQQFKALQRLGVKINAAAHVVTPQPPVTQKPGYLNPSPVAGAIINAVSGLGK